MANGDLSAPFSLDELREQMKKLQEAEAYLQRAVAAGIDMSEQQKRTAELRAQLTKFGQAFYPGKV